MHKISIILILFISFIYSQAKAQEQGLTIEQYEDSVKQAKHINDSIAQIPVVTPAPITDSDTSSCLTSRDSNVIDSLDYLISSLETRITNIKRIGKESKGSRLEAIEFYLKKFCISKDSANFYIDLITEQTKLEYEGTQYIRVHDCGSNKIRALAHTKKLDEDIKKLTEFKLSLNRESYRITTKNKYAMREE